MKEKYFIITLLLILMINVKGFAQSPPGIADSNVAQPLALTLLEEASQKAPYKYPVLIQDFDCEENCNPINLFLDHTTLLLNEKGKAIKVYKFKAGKVYKIARFRVQNQNPNRLEEVVFIK